MGFPKWLELGEKNKKKFARLRNILQRKGKMIKVGNPEYKGTGNLKNKKREKKTAQKDLARRRSLTSDWRGYQVFFWLSYMTYLSTKVNMADHDMSPLHGKKPCRACTSFKSWMRQENRRKSTAVSFYLTMKVKEKQLQ